MSVIFQFKGKGTTLQTGDMIVVNGGGGTHKVRVLFMRGREALLVKGENGVTIPLHNIADSIELAELIAATHNLSAVLPDVQTPLARALFKKFEDADYVFVLGPPQ